jgi:PAS domain S-box-containing protein
VETKKNSKAINLDFTHLPSYAQYLLTHKFEELVDRYREVSAEANLQLLKKLDGIPQEEQQRVAAILIKELLTNLAENNAQKQINNILTSWKENQLPFLNKFDVGAEDIARISFIRKKSFLHFLPEYAVDSTQMLQVIEEIDTFLLHYDLAATDIFINLMQSKIDDHIHLINKVNNTLPGAVYIFDMNEYKNIYANEKLEQVIGYTQAELNEFGIDASSQLVHPDDLETMRKHISFMKEVPDGKIYSYKYRIRLKDGRYKWIRNYESVFKRDPDGSPSQLIAISLDIDKEKRIAEQLKESEAQLLEAQAIAHLGNWSWDIKTNHITWSDELYRIFETDINSEVLSFEKYISFIHPEDRELVKRTINDSITNATPYNLYHRLVFPNGKVKTIHSRGEVLKNQQGETFKLFGIAQDVTEQFSIQQELKEKQIFIRKIADATPSIIASYNVNTGKYVFISEGIEKLLGYSPDEVLKGGMEFLTSIIHPEDLPGIIEKNAKALEEANHSSLNKDTVAEFTYRMRNSKGEYRWFHTYGTIFDRNKEGSVEHVLNISLDVTESIEATRKIEEQEYFIQQIADASPTILYLFDVGSNSFDYLNREIFYVLNYSPEEILAMGAKAITNLYHPDDVVLLPERKGSPAKFQHKESMMQYECRLRNKNGEWCWFLVREIVFRKTGDGQQVEKILGAALDISKRKEMEKTLLQNSFQLEQSNSSLEEFAYVASHDLKEPLRKISTFGDRMSATQADRLTDDGKIYLKKIVDASQRMQLMIDDLLSVSMISGNRSFENFSLQSILDDARQAVEFKIEQKSAIIESTPLPEANIVPSQFRQLFQNLLGNSLKFTRESVQPVIKISHKIVKPEEVAHLQLPKAASYLQLEFEDNGIGFENEFAGKIFQIFHRLHGRSEYEGTGIGLAICKKIVEHHGGVIFATSRIGEGAKFTIILPR